MIPERVVEVLSGPAFMQVGTRNAGLRPAHAWVVGARVHPDRETVTFFVPEGRARRVLNDLEANARVALGASFASHESYQLKGTYVSARPTDAADLALQEAYRASLFSAAREAGYPEEIARPFTLGFAYRPGVAITFRVEEIFVQTPGPDAGRKIV